MIHSLLLLIGDCVHMDGLTRRRSGEVSFGFGFQRDGMSSASRSKRSLTWSRYAEEFVKLLGFPKKTRVHTFRCPFKLNSIGRRYPVERGGQHAWESFQASTWVMGRGEARGARSTSRPVNARCTRQESCNSTDELASGLVAGCHPVPFASFHFGVHDDLASCVKTGGSRRAFKAHTSLVAEWCFSRTYTTSRIHS
jgi:hypothetical protein